MRTDTEFCFKMLGVHKQTCKFVFVKLKPEKNTKTNIVNAAFHSTVHCFRMIFVVVLRSCRMKRKIAFFMVCFLEKNICADFRFFKFAVVFNRCCRNINVNTTDCTIFMVNSVNCLYGIKDIFNRVILRVFTCFDCKTLVSHILKCNNLFFDFFLRKLFTCNMFIAVMIRTVYASVYTIVGKVKRCKHNYTVTVKCELDFFRNFIDFLYFFGDFTCKKNRCFAVCKTAATDFVANLFRFCLFKKRINKLYVVFVFFCISYSFKNFFVIDEFFCY